MIKKRILLFSLLTLFFSFMSQAYAHPVPLTNYNDVLLVLQRGNHIQSVSNLNQCSPSANDNITLGSIEFNHAIVYNQEKNGKTEQVIGLSNTIETTHDEGLTSKYTKSYIKLHLYENNTIEFLVQNFDSTGSEISHKSYICQLNKGVLLYLIA